MRIPTLAELAFISILCMPFAIMVFMIPVLGPPAAMFRKRAPKHDATLMPPPLPPADDAGPGERIAIDCTRCGPSPVPYSRTCVIQVGPGYALTAVCPAEVLDDAGRIVTCGRSMITAIVDASVAAEFLHQGATSVHPRMVAWRAELATVSTAAEFDAAVEAARTP